MIENIKINYFIDLGELAQEIAFLDHSGDIKEFIKTILCNTSDFDFELELILDLFDYLNLEEVIKENNVLEENNEYIKDFLLELREKIDKNLKEID
jgi:hypothetical protein